MTVEYKISLTLLP